MKNLLVIGLLVLLFVCTIPAASADADLIVDRVDPKYVFVDLENSFFVNVTNQGDAASGVFDVYIEITNAGSTVLYSYEAEDCASLDAGESSLDTRCLDISLGSWMPGTLEDITITVTADYDDEVVEDDEGNNVLVDTRTTTGDCDVDNMLPDTCYGYRGQHPMNAVYDGTGKVIYTYGDSVSKGSIADFIIGPAGDMNQVDGGTAYVRPGATVTAAKLYIYYDWRKSETGPNPGVDPTLDFEMSFDGNSLTAENYYTDIKEFAGSQYQYGTIVYDVTAYVTGNGNYQAVRSNHISDPHDGKGYDRAISLMIMYDDYSGDTYSITHGYDRLATLYWYGGSYRPNQWDYYVSPDDATTTATLTDIDPAAVTAAKLFSVAIDTTDGTGTESQKINSCSWSEGAWSKDSGSYLTFNRSDVTACITPSGADEIISMQEGLQQSSNGFSAINAMVLGEAVPEASVFFDPADSGADHGDTQIVGIWLDTTVPISTGSGVFYYEPTCANVIGSTPNSAVWDFMCSADLSVPGEVGIGFGTMDPAGKDGLVHIMDIEIQCECVSYCKTGLIWDVDSSKSILEITGGGNPNPTKWIDGTFTCTNLPDLVVTTVYGTQTTGDDYEVTYTVENQGNAMALAGHSTALYLDGVWQEDLPVTVDLAPGDTHTDTFTTVLTMTIPNDLLMVCADTDDVVMELDEGNNCMPSYYPAGIEVKVDVLDDGECVDLGEQFLVNITVDPRNIPVYGVQYTLSFNNQVLHCEWQNEGTFLNSDGAETNVYINTIDNGAGTITFAATRKNTPDGVTDPGTLAVIKFTAIQQGANSDLNLSDVVASNNGGIEILPVDLVDDNVCVTENQPPVAVGKSMHTYNNEGEKYICKTYLNGSESYDPDGDIISWRWDCGDGNYPVGEEVEHVYRSWNWNGTGYDPFTVILTVEDDSQTENNTQFDVIVYTAGDANGDGKVNILDATIVGLEWGATTDCIGGYCWLGDERGDKADLNNDKKVNILDAVIIGTCWGHTAWV